MDKVEIFERSVDNLGQQMAGWLREKDQNITDAEIKESARNFIEFIRILRAMDMEQKARNA